MRKTFVILIILFTSLLFIQTDSIRETEINSVMTDHHNYQSLSENKLQKIVDSQNKIKQFKEHKIKDKSTRVSISISFAGDCTLGQDIRQGNWNTFPTVAEREGYDFFFKEVQTVFAHDDLTIVNLETTLTTSEDFEPNKKWRYKGSPDYTEILKIGNIEAVHIANNHMHDYKRKGFEDTIEALEKADIIYYGNDTMSQKWNTRGGHLGYDIPRVINIQGIKIALLGYKGWYDNENNREKIQQDINHMKENADVIIVSYHWGDQRVYYPNQMQKDLGRFTIDCGADIVVGHHPHVIQGIEKYKDKFIVYSLGNFSFGGNRNPEDRDCIIFQSIFTLENGKLVDNKGKIIPCKISTDENINNFQPIVLNGTEKQRVLDRIYKYSEALEYGIKPVQLPVNIIE